MTDSHQKLSTSSGPASLGADLRIVSKHLSFTTSECQSSFEGLLDHTARNYNDGAKSAYHVMK